MARIDNLGPSFNPDSGFTTFESARCTVLIWSWPRGLCSSAFELTTYADRFKQWGIEISSLFTDKLFHWYSALFEITLFILEFRQGKVLLASQMEKIPLDATSDGLLLKPLPT